MPSVKLQLSEKQITEQVKGFLETKGWLYLRLQSGLLRTMDKRFLRVGKPGTPDAVAVNALYREGYTQTLFLEFKRAKGGKLSADQVAWHAEARRNRLTVLVISDFKEFKVQYDDLYKARRGDDVCGSDPTLPLHLI